MVDTAFDRAERGLGSTDLSVADIVAKTRGNPNEIMKLVMAGQINLTQGLLAKRLSDSVVAEQQKAAAPTTTVLQDSFPQLAPAMGGLQPPAAPMAPAAPQGMGPVAPQMQAPQGMAEGGLAQLDFAAPDYAGGGIVAFAEGGELDADDFIRLVERLETGGRGDYDERGRPITSRAGARYAMQVMPATARNPGFGIRPAQADTAEEYNRVGRDYARMLLARYGNPTDALVAYNAGPGRADRWIAGGRNPNALPGETREYLARAGRASTTSNTAENAPAASTAAPSSARNYLLGNFEQLTATPNIDVGSFLSQLPEQSREALQRYRERVERQEDPEKARERAELGALFQSIGNVRPGMNPLAALAQGFATSGASMQAAEERAQARELEQLRTAADLERMENQMGRENFQLAFDMARVQAGLADSATARRVAILTAAMDDETKRAVEQASLELRRTLGERELSLTQEGQMLDYILGKARIESGEGSGGNTATDIVANMFRTNPALSSVFPGGPSLSSASIQPFGVPPTRPPVRVPSYEEARTGGYEGFEIVR